MEKDPGHEGGLQATMNIVSAIPPQPLMAAASSSPDDMMGTMIDTIRRETEKVLPQSIQNSPHSRSISTVGR